MSFCIDCGKQIEPNEVTCTRCGKPINRPVIKENVDTGRFLWIFVGMANPVVGLLLYLLWKPTKPRTAKRLLFGMIFGSILFVAFYIGFIAISIFLEIGAYDYGLLFKMWM